MPEGHVLQGGHGVSADHAGQSGEAFPGDRVALVRHGAASLLASGKGFLSLQNFGALQVTELHGPVLEARGDERQAVHELGMDVALDDLRGDGCRPQVQTLAYMGFHRGRQVGMGTDGAAEFANGNNRVEMLEASEGP